MSLARVFLGAVVLTVITAPGGPPDLPVPGIGNYRHSIEEVTVMLSVF